LGAHSELLSLTPDVILANGTNALRAVQQATRIVPIVFTTVIEVGPASGDRVGPDKARARSRWRFDRFPRRIHRHSPQAYY
jgi:hypothetical protein